MSGGEAELVAAGYDRLAATYDDWARQIAPDPRAGLLERIVLARPDRRAVPASAGWWR